MSPSNAIASRIRAALDPPMDLAQFRAFLCDNASQMYRGANPDFFRGHDRRGLREERRPRHCLR